MTGVPFSFGGILLSEYLATAARAYREICRFSYTFSFSNGETIKLVFKPQNFVHLAGLRKLNDVYEFQTVRNAINIYHDILRGNITDLHLQMSVHYDSDARERIENLARLEELLKTDKAIWNFDPKKSKVVTRLKSKVIFFKPDGFDFYLMLGAAPNGVTWYPETFFFRFDDQYLTDQEIVSIQSMIRKTV